MEQDIKSPLLPLEKTRETRETMSTWNILDRASRQLRNRFSDIIEQDSPHSSAYRINNIVIQQNSFMDRTDSFSTIKLIEDSDFQQQERQQLSRNQLQQRFSVDQMIDESDSQMKMSREIFNQIQELESLPAIGRAVSTVESLHLKNRFTLHKSQPIKPKVIPQDLNERIFSLRPKIQGILYIFNFLLNVLLRSTFIFLLIWMIAENKKHSLMEFVVAMECVSMLLYAIALGKLLHTKQTKISIYFQKFFFEKPYYDIHMDRMLRKHFTLNRFKRNFIRFLNPRTEFKMNTKISLMRQEIFKRIELVLCIIPFMMVFFLYPKQFQFEGWNSQALVAAIITIQVLRTTIHYLVIYVFS